MNETVAQLKEYMKKFQQYQTIESLLSWDLSTMTPEKGSTLKQRRSDISPQNHSVLLHRKNTAKS